MTYAFNYNVYYEDTDAGGIVYHANYLKFAERARTDMVKLLGIDQKKLFEEDKIVFVVKKIEIEYKSPGFLGDTLEVTCDIKSKGRSSFILEQIIYTDRNGAKIELASLIVVIVSVQKTEHGYKACRLNGFDTL